MAVNVDLEDQTNHALIRLCLGFVPKLCASVPRAPAAPSLVACLHCTKHQFRFCTRPSFLALSSFTKEALSSRADFQRASNAPRKLRHAEKLLPMIFQEA